MEPCTLISSLFSLVAPFNLMCSLCRVCSVHIFWCLLLFCCVLLFPCRRKNFPLVGLNLSWTLSVKGSGKTTLHSNLVSHRSQSLFMSLPPTCRASSAHVMFLRLNETLLYLWLIEWKHRPGRPCSQLWLILQTCEQQGLDVTVVNL